MRRVRSISFRFLRVPKWVAEAAGVGSSVLMRLDGIRRAVGIGSAVVCCAFAGLAGAQVYPAQVPPQDLESAPYSSAGFLWSVSGAGSGAVARDPRLIYSCAHVLFENGKWAPSLRFSRAYSGRVAPSNAASPQARGYRYYAGYSAGVRGENFAADFTVAYGTALTNFGPALEALQDSSAAIGSPSVSKLILGYPAKVEYTGAEGFCYQHRTGPFPNAFSKVLDAYFECYGVSTGRGNSGGPVLVLQDGSYKFAGVLVSGAKNASGIHGLDATTHAMGTAALVQAGAGLVFPPAEGGISFGAPAALPDAAKRYVRRSVVVKSASPSIANVSLSLSIQAEFRGDLDVYVRSPRGRIAWIASHDFKDDEKNLLLEGETITQPFEGTSPYGTWSLFMRDFYKGDASSFLSGSLTVQTR